MHQVAVHGQTQGVFCQLPKCYRAPQVKRLVYGLVPAIGSWELPAGGVTQPPWSHQAQSSTDFSAVQEIMSSIKKTKNNNNNNEEGHWAQPRTSCHAGIQRKGMNTDRHCCLGSLPMQTSCTRELPVCGPNCSEPSHKLN